MLRKILEIRRAPPKHWVGDGFHVSSMFSYADDPGPLSPFLLLDYAAPRDVAPSTGEPQGVGEHPHRGFETVTIAYQGVIEHRDSGGHRGRIGPGDVQWMTAASGVVHEEKLGRDFTKTGGTLEMVQLWVNLPAKLKMSPPRYQDLSGRDIPEVQLAGGAGSARIIAGAFEGAKGPAKTHTPLQLWDLTLKAGRPVELGPADGHNALLLVQRGAVELNGSASVGASELAMLGRQGTLALKAVEDSRALLMSGEPIDEPVAGYGPFVMNSRAEIEQAVRDYQGGRMGRLAP